MSNSIIFSVTTYNRSFIACESIEDLLQKIRGDKIFITDDCSDEIFICAYLDTKERLYPTMLIEVFKQDENKGVDYNNATRLLNFKLEDNRYVYLTDSDMIYSSQFYKQLMSAKEVLDIDKDIFAISLFSLNHTGTHPIISQYEKNVNYNIKSSFGGCSVLIKYNDFKQSMEFYQSDKYDGKEGWDWALCHYAHKKNRKLLATNLSFVQHIGKEGVNSSPICFDSALNFIP